MFFYVSCCRSFFMDDIREVSRTQTQPKKIPNWLKNEKWGGRREVADAEAIEIINSTRIEIGIGWNLWFIFSTTVKIQPM